MTNKKIKILPILILIIIALLSSCGEGVTDRFSNSDVDYLMTSYYILRGDTSLADSRAAWPAHTNPLTFPAAGATTTTFKNNYPEKGQQTTVTITPHASLADIYLVENVTTYPKREEVLSKTTESYYVKDNDADGQYTSADLLWDIDAGAQDFNKRIKYETEYQDGKIRYEIVEANTVDDGINYEAFDINGALTFPTPASGEIWSPPADAAALYSSMVSYQQEEGSALDVWSDYKMVIGARYYTEHGDPAKPTKTSVTYEKVIERKADEMTPEQQIQAFFARLFTDDPSGVAFPGETLAETVIRYEITPNKRKTVKTDTTIYDSNDGSTIVTFSANFVEDENGVVTNSGAPVAVY